MANSNARALRKNLTPQEVRLWVKLREMKALGFHFRRQAPIRNYIVDFASFRDCVVIEVDGGQHGMEEGARKDAVRDAFLRDEGFRVLRFWNFEIDENLEGVMEVVLSALQSPPTDRPDGRPPQRGRIRPRDPTARAGGGIRKSFANDLDDERPGARLSPAEIMFDSASENPHTLIPRRAAPCRRRARVASVR
ncbi:MAG: hypothetical protein JWR49_885 [Tardiphaga sp.]|jgi:very-short-patch-repair endonuclease|nr:hypothetical protein [Tardiphaga sp.]